MPQPFAIVCPHCSRSLTSRIAVTAGRKLRCPHCRMVFTAPAAHASDVPPPPKRHRLAAGLVLGGLGISICLTIGLIWYFTTHGDRSPLDSVPPGAPTERAEKPAGDELPAVTPLLGSDRPPGKDFGPLIPSTAPQRAAAAKAWQSWWKTQEKK